MCNYTVTTWGCGCVTFQHEVCAVKKGAEFPHFLQCPITEESRLSSQKCKTCSRRMKADAHFATPDPRKETKSGFLGGPHGWNMRNLIPRKTKEAEVKGNGKTVLLVGDPVFNRQMFAPLQHGDVVVQPTSSNGVDVHPLRQNAVTKHPLTGNKIQRELAFASTTSNQEDELCFDDRPSTAAAAHQIEIETKQILNDKPSRHVQSHNSAAASQNAGFFFDDRPSTPTAATKAQKDITKILGHELSPRFQYCGSAAAAQRSELLFDDRPSTAEAARKAANDTQVILYSQSRNPHPTSLTDVIPELQSYAPYCPPVDTDKLMVYLTEVAIRPRPHKLLSAEDEDALYFAQHSEQYSAIREATAAALQNVEPAFEPRVERILSCLVPGPREKLKQGLRTKEGKERFDALTFAQVPKHFEFPKPEEQERFPDQVVAIEPLRPATTIPLHSTPKPKKARTAPPPPTSSQPLPNRANSRAAPGWENFDPSSLSPAPLEIRKKKSATQPLTVQVKASASALAPLPAPRARRTAPQIPRLQRISALKFDGTLLQGFEGIAKPQIQEQDLHGRGRLEVGRR